MVIDNTKPGTEELIGAGYLPLLEYLKWCGAPKRTDVQDTKTVWINLYPTRSHFDSEINVKGPNGKPSKVLLNITCTDSVSKRKILPPRPPRPLTGSNVPTPNAASFNAISDPNNKDFSMGLRDYRTLEPTVEQTRRVGPEEGIKKAKCRYNYILEKKEQKAREREQQLGGSSFSSPGPQTLPLEPTESQVADLAEDFQPVPLPPQSPLTGPLKALLSRTFYVIANEKGNRGETTIRLKALVEFGRFIGLEWAGDVTKLKSELLTLGVSTHASHLEFKSVNKVDHTMFVSFVNGKITNREYEYRNFIRLVEGFLAYKTMSERKRELLNSAVIITREQAPLSNVDYLHLYHLGHCLKKGFSWDDCNEIKMALIRCDDDEKAKEKVLLGFLSRLVEDHSDDAVTTSVHDFMAVVEELEGSKGIIGQDAEIIQSPPNPKPPLSEAPQAKEVESQGDMSGDVSFASFSNSVATSNHSSRIPKLSAKTSHFIRAAFRTMPKTPANSLAPKVVKHFGQYLGFDWALTYDEGSSSYILDGDSVGSELSEQSFLTFCGRRLGVLDDKKLSIMGKGYLAAVRGSSYRRRIIDGALRVLLCSETGGVELEEIFHLTKCISPRYTVEEAQQAHGLVHRYDSNKNVRRSVFEGLLSSVLLKKNVDDGSFTTAVERFVESIGMDKLGENARSSRKASIALLKMDMSGEEAPEPDQFKPDRMDFSFGFAPTEASSSFSHNAVANNTSIKEKRGMNNSMQEVSFISNLTAPNYENSFQTITDEPVEESAIHDLHTFIAKAKQAKESARSMKIRDQRIKQGYLSSQDREELFGEKEVVIIGAGARSETVEDNVEAEKVEDLGWGRREKKKPYKRYDAASESEGEVASHHEEAKPKTTSNARFVSPAKNTLLNRTAAKVIQTWARERLTNHEMKEREAKVVNEGTAAAAAATEVPKTNQDAAAPPVDLNNLLLSLALSQSQGNASNTSNESNNNGNNNSMQQQLLSLLLSQQQKQEHQQQQPVQQPPMQQQLVQQIHQSSPYPPPAPFYQPSVPSQDDVNYLRDELERSKSLMESRLREVEMEKEREMEELVRFKEAASAHLRAQNMTIKRLSAKRDFGTVPNQPPVHESIMERVKRGTERTTESSSRKGERSKPRTTPPFNYTSKGHF